MKIITGNIALENLRSNKEAQWPGRNRGNERLKPIALPRTSPSFEINSADKIFTIGSCFARNVESHLLNAGLDVVSNPESFQFPEAYTNKYTPKSIEFTFEHALAADHSRQEDFGITEIGESKYLDVFANPLEGSALEDCRNWRKSLDQMGGKIKECRIIIITLGLNEVWYDNTMEHYVNRLPPLSYVRENPERYSLHVLDIDDVRASLNHIYLLLQRHGHPDFKLLITVSPVPLLATFTEDDVFVANGYSKSVLRVAAEELANTHENVDYFGSYESVTLSSREITWEADNRHVSFEVVSKNVSHMMEKYAPTMKLPGFEEFLKKGIHHLNNQEYVKAENALVKAVDLNNQSFSAFKHLGISLARLAKFNRAERAYQQALAFASKNQQTEIKFLTATMYQFSGRLEEAQSLLEEVTAGQPSWAAAHYHLAEIHEKLGDTEMAISILSNAIDLNPSNKHLKKQLLKFQTIEE